MINMSYDYEKAKNKLLTFALDDECQSFFEKNNCILELAYCNLLKGELEGAENLFKHLLGADPGEAFYAEFYLINLPPIRHILN